MLRSCDPSRLGLDDSRDERLPDFFFRERVGVLGADSDPMNLKGVAASGCREAAPPAKALLVNEDTPFWYFP